ncbi:MAG: histidine triad nucleotide-binding protein [Actinomycetota bacterium]|nr:histidine triad nucleotide-binding protein [Actinomycetota bacterium]
MNADAAPADCLFCKIVAGDIPADIVHRDERTLAFRDLAPKAPTHVLVIPVTHSVTIADTAAGDAALVGELVATAAGIAAADGIAESGYRMVFNTGADAGQTVFHAHLHLLGGRALGWPPG